jgi:LPXTG-site transpeptidase (sortase) family protein
MPVPRCSGKFVLELACWIVGFGLILSCMATSASLDTLRDLGVRQFYQARATALAGRHIDAPSLPIQSLAPGGWQSAHSTPDRLVSDEDAALPIAILRIAALEMEVPVYRDLSELNLSRGAGWIGGTAAPNTDGNMAIAAHRDRSFRPLKDIRIGDRLVLDSLSGQRQYRVSRLDIVDPDDVSVLDDSSVPTVTLVTCYPFYFIGNAPQRFIVQATAVDQPEKASRLEALLTAIPSGETP